MDNQRRVVAVLGVMWGRFGFPLIPGAQTCSAEEPPDTMAVGRPSVARPPYKGPLSVRPAGLSAPALSAKPLVEPRHRNVFAGGMYATVMGGPLWGDKPYSWRGLHVGPPMPTVPGGFAAEVFGGAWASLRVRGIAPEGMETFASEYDIHQFARRMRVGSVESPVPPQHIAAQGHQSSACGWHQVRPMRHYIRPDGNSDQHRKGVFTA